MKHFYVNFTNVHFVSRMIDVIPELLDVLYTLSSFLLYTLVNIESINIEKCK